MKTMTESNRAKTSAVYRAIAAILLEYAVLLGILWFQQRRLMSLSLPIRAGVMIVLQWLLLIVPVVFMKRQNENIDEYGFSKEKIGAQVISGILIAAVLSCVLTVLPILAGYKDMVGSSALTKPWQFCYQFVYMIFAVALAEEFFYRGFLYKKLLDIHRSKWFATIGTSLVFGFSHLFRGNLLQVLATSILGVILCLCRERIKHCTTLSLVIAHGMHNALITLLVAIL